MYYSLQKNLFLRKPIRLSTVWAALMVLTLRQAPQHRPSLWLCWAYINGNDCLNRVRPNLLTDNSLVFCYHPQLIRMPHPQYTPTGCPKTLQPPTANDFPGRPKLHTQTDTTPSYSMASKGARDCIFGKALAHFRHWITLRASGYYTWSLTPGIVHSVDWVVDWQSTHCSVVTCAPVQRIQLIWPADLRTAIATN
jgi:hypothetical protein